MRSAALVAGLWLFVGLIVAWALATEYATDRGIVALYVPLIAVPVVLLSVFLWLLFERELRGW